MRRYVNLLSIAAHIPREVVGEGITIDGTFYPAGTVVGVTVYALHHNEDYFPDPYVFKPERWIVNEKTGVTQESVGSCPISVQPPSQSVQEAALAKIWLIWS